MEITKLPDSYAGAYGDILYEIDSTNREELVEVEVLGADGETVRGIRKFCGDDAYKVNVAGYLRNDLDVGPLKAEKSGFYCDAGRTSVSRIAVGSIVTDALTVTAGMERADKGVILSDAPIRLEIACGERDEISFVAPGEMISAEIGITGKSEYKSLAIDGYEAGEGMITLLLDVDDIILRAGIENPDQCREMSVTVNVGDVDVLSRKYFIRPYSAVSERICWINRFGAVDYYTFNCEQGAEVSVGKGRIYGNDGYKVLSSSAETLHRLISQFEPQALMRWLSEITASPGVWRIKQGEFWPVDVVTGSSYYGRESLHRLLLDIRDVEKTEYRKG